jgi:hypothetical protein
VEGCLCFVSQLFLRRRSRWRAGVFYRIVAVMRPVTRGLITSLFWLGLALGFTGALSNVLEDRQAIAAPDDVRTPVR